MWLQQRARKKETYTKLETIRDVNYSAQEKRGILPFVSL